MNDENYWAQRKNSLVEQLEKDEKALYEKLNIEYERQLKNLEKEVAYYYQTYGKNNVIEYRNLMQKLSDSDKKMLFESYDEFAKKYPKYAHLMPVRKSIYRLNRLEGMKYSIFISQMEIGAVEQAAVRKHLEELYKNGYMSMAKGLGANLGSVRRDVLEKTINAKWCNGKNFSERIWGNREKLADYLNHDFSVSMARGDSYDKCIKELSKRFENVSKNDIKRLVYTEGTFVMCESQITAFENDPNYTHYKYITRGDGNVCSACDALNGKLFRIKDRLAGVNFPPMHSYCRCDFVALVNRKKDSGITKDIMENTLNKTVDSGIIKENHIVGGALNPESQAAYNHAEQYYNSVRKMTTDVKNIAANTGYKEKNIEQIKEHLFIKKHDLENGKERFSPIYEIAQSWQRLIDGKNIRPSDFILLKHEFMELKLMFLGYLQYEAHKKASKKYNYRIATEKELKDNG